MNPKGKTKDEDFGSFWFKLVHPLILFWPGLVIVPLLWFLIGGPDKARDELARPSILDAVEPTLPADDSWKELKDKIRFSPKKRESQRKANWISNFPYTETRHPTLTFNPSLYDPNDPSTWTGMNRRRFQPVVKAHGFMKGFFENERRYSRGFEQLYELLKEHDRHDNPLVTGGIFQNLTRYHEAADHPPDEIMMQEEFTEGFDKFGRPITNLVPAEHYGPTGELLPPQTWGEKAHGLAESIVYKIQARKEWPDKERIPEDEAISLRDRILAEIDPSDIPQGPGFGYYNEHEKSLRPGEAYLIPYEGWTEALWQYQQEVVIPAVELKAAEAIRQMGSK